MDPHQILLSIVVVTYKDLDGLRRTLRSLEHLREVKTIEILVADGDTGPGFEQVVEETGDWVSFVSEPDRGVYDAMNKGLTRSTGRFVWFLNGGDECAEENWVELASTLESNRDRLLLYAYWLDLGRRRMLRHPRKSSYIWHGLPTSHQAILYPGDAIRANPYDLRFSMVGDYEVTARLLANGVKAVVVDRPLATFFTGGMSQTGARLVASEAAVVQKSVLGLGRTVRLASRLRHFSSRWARRILTRAEPVSK